MPIRLKEAREDERLVEYSFYRKREFFAIQLPTEIIVAPLDKSDPALDLQTAIYFGCNSKAEINSFFDYIGSKDNGLNLRSNKPHVSCCR